VEAIIGDLARPARLARTCAQHRICRDTCDPVGEQRRVDLGVEPRWLSRFADDESGESLSQRDEEWHDNCGCVRETLARRFTETNYGIESTGR
jgi:hypothetical protein